MEEKEEYHLNNVCVSDRASPSAPIPRGKIPYNLPQHDDTHRARHSACRGGGRPYLLTFHSTYRFMPYGFSIIGLFISFYPL